VPSLGEMGTVAGQSKLGLIFLTRIEPSVSIANAHYIINIPWYIYLKLCTIFVKNKWSLQSYSEKFIFTLECSV
jgi:hypothetical protein